QARRVVFACRAAGVGAKWLETAIQDAAVSEVVEAHRRRGDVRLEGWGARCPFRIAKAEHLLVVRDAEDEVGEAQTSPGDQRWMTSALRPMASQHQRPSSSVA